MSVNLYRCGPRRARQYIVQCIQAGLVPYLQASPGVGKSAIHRSIAREFYLWLIDHRLSTSAPEDLSGLPQFVDGVARFAPFADLFPIKGTRIPEGYQGWMVFLDEFPSAPRSVQAAAYKLVLDRMIGQHPLHENVVLCAAGNLITDRAIVNNIGTAMQSRLVHIEMEVVFKEWLEDVAYAEKYDQRIIAFLSQYEGKLMDFRPDHTEKTFCCPRTWEFVNRLIKDRELTDEDTALLAGTITSGVAVEFVQFTKVYKDLVTEYEIRKDPAKCRIPKDTSLMWAVLTAMVEKVTEENFKDLATYANRFDMTFRVLFYRLLRNRKPAMRAHPVFRQALIELSKYLNDEDKT